MRSSRLACHAAWREPPPPEGSFGWHGFVLDPVDASHSLLHTGGEYEPVPPRFALPVQPESSVGERKRGLRDAPRRSPILIGHPNLVCQAVVDQLNHAGPSLVHAVEFDAWKSA